MFEDLPDDGGAGAAVRRELECLRPCLERRLEYMEETGRMSELERQVEDIEFYLEVIDDPTNVSTHGVAQLRNIISDINDLSYKNPLPIGWKPKKGLKRSSGNPAADKLRAGNRAFEEWKKAQKDDWDDDISSTSVNSYEERKKAAENQPWNINNTSFNTNSSGNPSGAREGGGTNEQTKPKGLPDWLEDKKGPQKKTEDVNMLFERRQPPVVRSQFRALAPRLEQAYGQVPKDPRIQNSGQRASNANVPHWLFGTPTQQASNLRQPVPTHIHPRLVTPSTQPTFEQLSHPGTPKPIRDQASGVMYVPMMPVPQSNPYCMPQNFPAGPPPQAFNPYNPVRVPYQPQEFSNPSSSSGYSQSQLYQDYCRPASVSSPQFAGPSNCRPRPRTFRNENPNRPYYDRSKDHRNNSSTSSNYTSGKKHAPATTSFRNRMETNVGGLYKLGQRKIVEETVVRPQPEDPDMHEEEDTPDIRKGPNSTAKTRAKAAAKESEFSDSTKKIIMKSFKKKDAVELLKDPSKVKSLCQQLLSGIEPPSNTKKSHKQEHPNKSRKKTPNQQCRVARKRVACTDSDESQSESSDNELGSSSHVGSTKSGPKSKSSTATKQQQPARKVQQARKRTPQKVSNKGPSRKVAVAIPTIESDSRSEISFTTSGDVGSVKSNSKPEHGRQLRSAESIKDKRKEQTETEKIAAAATPTKSTRQFAKKKTQSKSSNPEGVKNTKAKESRPVEVEENTNMNIPFQPRKTAEGNQLIRANDSVNNVVLGKFKMESDFVKRVAAKQEQDSSKVSNEEEDSFLAAAYPEVYLRVEDDTTRLEVEPGRDHPENASRSEERVQPPLAGLDLVALKVEEAESQVVPAPDHDQNECQPPASSEPNGIGSVETDKEMEEIHIRDVASGEGGTVKRR